MSFLKRLASRLPAHWQQELKRLQYRRRIHRRTFESTEPGSRILAQLITPGDWVIDVGANVGEYTKRLSDLVGASGRVVAVEPVPDTFALLAANVALFEHRNVTLLNLAASDRSTLAGMEVPVFETGLKDYYDATITGEASDLQVMTLALDSLRLEHRVSVIKIDAEGHDPAVLSGADALLARDHPALIVETLSPAAVERLANLGYESEKLPGSGDTLCRWRADGTRAGHAEE